MRPTIKDWKYDENEKFQKIFENHKRLEGVFL